MPNTYACKGVSNPNVPMFPPRVCTLVLFIYYTVLMHNRSCFTRKQTCNGEYTKHCMRNRHQLKMAASAEVSEKRSNFRIRQF